MAITMPNLVKIPQIKKRPPGTHFLGASNVILPGSLLSIDAQTYDILFDTGAAVSLISDLVYSRLTDKPKQKNGI